MERKEIMIVLMKSERLDKIKKMIGSLTYEKTKNIGLELIEEIEKCHKIIDQLFLPPNREKING
jgi:hypothetical protein